MNKNIWSYSIIKITLFFYIMLCTNFSYASEKLLPIFHNCKSPFDLLEEKKKQAAYNPFSCQINLLEEQMRREIIIACYQTEFSGERQRRGVIINDPVFNPTYQRLIARNSPKDPPKKQLDVD